MSSGVTEYSCDLPLLAPILTWLLGFSVLFLPCDLLQGYTEKRVRRYIEIS